MYVFTCSRLYLFSKHLKAFQCKFFTLQYKIFSFYYNVNTWNRAFVTLYTTHSNRFVKYNTHNPLLIYSLLATMIRRGIPARLAVAIPRPRPSVYTIVSILSHIALLLLLCDNRLSPYQPTSRLLFVNGGCTHRLNNVIPYKSMYVYCKLEKASLLVLYNKIMVGPVRGFV